MEDKMIYVAPLVISLGRYFLFAGIPFLIFYILFPKLFLHNKIQASSAKRKDFWREVLHSVQSSFIFVGVALLILETPLAAYTQFYTTAVYPSWWVPVSVVLALILHDTYFYWMHRTLHHPSLYKKFHLVHHQSVNPSPWASYSFHAVEAVLEALIVPLTLFLIPINAWGLLAFTMTSFIINVYGHLGYEIAPKWVRNSVLFKVFNTSVHHNLHHSKFQGNYGLYFRFWDRVMGTEFVDYEQVYDQVQEQRFGKEGVEEYEEGGISSVASP